MGHGSPNDILDEAEPLRHSYEGLELMAGRVGFDAYARQRAKGAGRYRVVSPALSSPPRTSAPSVPRRGAARA